MRIERIRVCDVIENENNPREDFGDLQKLADSFMVNEMNPGEPFSPPAVVQDGSMFRILEGARRFRAMKLLGKEWFNAVVCDPINDQDEILAMLATDNKKVLTEEERCRGVQQALVLGIDPQKVEKAAGIRGTAKVKRGMQRAGDRAEQMTLEHLIAVEEAETDEEADVIASLPNGKWQIEVIRIEKEKAAKSLAEDMRNWCRANSIPLIDDASDDMEFKVHKLVVNTVSLLQDYLETNGREDGLSVCVTEYASVGSARAAIYANAAGGDRQTREERELEQKVDERTLMADDCVRAVTSFAYESFVDTGEIQAHLMAYAAEYFVGSKTRMEMLENAMSGAGCSIEDASPYTGIATGLVCALVFGYCKPSLTSWQIRACIIGKADPSAGEDAGSLLDFLLAAKADGCPMPAGWGFLRDDLATWEREFAKEADDEQ